MPRIPQLGLKQAVLCSAVLTALIEVVTVVLRFGLGLEASRDTASSVGRLTGGIRVHHGYFGLLAILVAIALLRRWPPVGRWLLVVGAALVLSDLVHHFLVLWPIVGSPEFHRLYP
jgi:hypothetical protein